VFFPTSKTRVFFISDIHGSDRLFFKFVNAATVYKAQVLIIGGDIAGKTIVPIFAEENNSYSLDFQGTKRSAQNKEELDLILKDVRALGNYPHITTRHEWEELTRHEKMMDDLFEVLIQESVGRWCSVAKERLKAPGVRVYMNKGNDDPNVLEETIKASDFVSYPNERIVNIDDKHEMLSLGVSNITPWHLPGDVPEEEIERRISACASKLSKVENAVFNIHVPPFKTHLDLAPKLDENLKPVLTPGGDPEFSHVGSTAVRRALETFQPLLGLHGHIHESRGFSQIGRTNCFNPGSEYSIGVLKGVILNLSDQKLDNYLFTSA
jgi:Icc-related predicted phosphoesterase